MYVSFERSTRYKQITFEDLFFNVDSDFKEEEVTPGSTITYKFNYPSERLRSMIDVYDMIGKLREFNKRYEALREVPRYDLYETFYREKSNKGMKYVFDRVFKSQKKYIHCDSKAVCSGIATILRQILTQHEGSLHDALYTSCKNEFMSFLSKNGFNTFLIDFDELISSAFRRIDAPKVPLYMALTELKNLFEGEFCENVPDHIGRAMPPRKLYHTSAFAYIKHRCTVDALKKHQKNASHWFGKYDLSNFFGSTTLEFTMKMFSMVFPFSEIVNNGGAEELEKALGLAFLHGGLPQGTPISPLITNIMMIPVDFELFKGFRKESQDFVYTRYADDFLVSSRKTFNPKEVEKKIVKVLAEFDAPFTIKSEKTRYGSNAGRNWNLGLMLNKDNQITVGHEKKRRFRAELSSYVMDRKNGIPWSLTDIQTMEGTRSYYSMVEPQAINALIRKINEKFSVDVIQMIKADLRNCA